MSFLKLSHKNTMASILGNVSLTLFLGLLTLREVSC